MGNNHRTIIKQLIEWNLYENLVWEDSEGKRRCQFFRHEIDSSLHVVIMEWLDPDNEAHTIVQFFCDPADDAAKLNFVTEYMNLIDRENES